MGSGLGLGLGIERNKDEADRVRCVQRQFAGCLAEPSLLPTTRQRARATGWYRCLWHLDVNFQVYVIEVLVVLKRNKT